MAVKIQILTHANDDDSPEALATVEMKEMQLQELLLPYLLKLLLIIKVINHYDLSASQEVFLREPRFIQCEANETLSNSECKGNKCFRNIQIRICVKSVKYKNTVLL